MNEAADLQLAWQLALFLEARGLLPRLHDREGRRDHHGVRVQRKGRPGGFDRDGHNG